MKEVKFSVAAKAARLIGRENIADVAKLRTFTQNRKCELIKIFVLDNFSAIVKI